MSDFEVKHTIYWLPLGSKVPVFSAKEVRLDSMRDTAGSITDKAEGHAVVCHKSQIIPSDSIMKNWFEDGSPIILVETPSLFEESDEWMKNPNQLARLLNSGLSIDAALQSLGRSYWVEGFNQFSVAASSLRQMVDHSGTFDYQRRLEVLCLANPQKTPMPVAPFNEFSRKLVLPPILRGDLSGGPLHGEWIEKPNKTVSMEERAQIQARVERIDRMKPNLEKAGEAVVKGFGYHPVQNSDQLRVVSFTAFFVSPRHVLTARTSKYSMEHDSYAQRFAISRRIRAVHGMLSEEEDLIPVQEVPGSAAFLVDTIRRLGVNLEDYKVPPAFQATGWSDLLLLEVMDPRYYSTSYLLPELDIDIRRDEEVFAMEYAVRPTQEWQHQVFGPTGHVGKSEEYSEEALRTMCWHYDTKLCAVGSVVENLGEVPVFKHNCTMMPGSRGAPILRNVLVETEGKHGNVDTYGEEMLPLTTYIGLSTGRAKCHFEAECDNIVQMSTGELAKTDSLASNMYNEATPCSHVSLVLLYQQYIAPAIKDTNHKLHLHKFLHPWSILIDSALLSKCHRAMLQDAEDDNEYGMDFYEHHDLNSAQACFREGAKMFSTASIPHLSQHDRELRSALQTNISAVVVAKMNQ